MATRRSLSNLFSDGIVKLTLSPAQVAANTTAEQTFTLTGVMPGDMIFVNKPTSQAGLGIVGHRVTAADTIGITFVNATGTPITPTASQVYLIYWLSSHGEGYPGVVPALQ